VSVTVFVGCMNDIAQVKRALKIPVVLYSMDFRRLKCMYWGRRNRNIAPYSQWMCSDLSEFLQNDQSTRKPSLEVALTILKLRTRHTTKIRPVVTSSIAEMEHFSSWTLTGDLALRMPHVGCRTVRTVHGYVSRPEVVKRRPNLALNDFIHL